MPSKADTLKQLLEEHERDRKSSYVFPERIRPRKSALFPQLTAREKGCLYLYPRMPRREIAIVLQIKPRSVTNLLKRTLTKLSEEEQEKYFELLGTRSSR